STGGSSLTPPSYALLPLPWQYPYMPAPRPLLHLHRPADAERVVRAPAHARPAIDVEDLPGHPGRVVGDQVADRAGHVFRRAEAAQRRLTDLGAPEPLDGQAGLVDLRLYRARSDGVDPHAVPTQFDR